MTKLVTKWFKDNKVNVAECLSENPVESYRKCLGRAEKVCASKVAYKPDSVTLVLSGGMGKKLQQTIVRNLRKETQNAGPKS